ncbi:MAG: ParB N-terminal domain-containing protein [Firmicutes bacterium]|nr:ParB N-terminal domain-containing protein [Candidatus Colivicinus equi]
MDNNLVGGLYNIDMLEELEKGKAEDVEIKLIEENKLNDIYDKRDLTDLKETIVKDGLLQPLVAYKKNDKYILISGHHRLRAIKELLSEGKDVLFFGKKIRDTVPVLIHKGFKDTNEELLVILHSNIGRKLSDDETDRISSEIIRIDSEMYPTKQSRPKGETKRKSIEKISPISAKTIERHTNKTTDEKDVKYKNIISKLNRFKNYISSIDLLDLGNMEKQNIKIKIEEINEILYQIH